MNNSPDVIAIWVFPKRDLSRVRGLCPDHAWPDYAAFLTAVAAVQADQERQGRRVVRVAITLNRMLAELAVRGWPNDQEHRAAVAATRLECEC